MKRLSRIILVNWYLFEAAEFEVKGHVALVGKNGSGKSSFIDAMQYVLLGGHKGDWNPNAKATDRRRTRDVRSYVLGLIKDEQAIEGAASYQPRPDALCRIILVFTDEETGDSTSIGAAISARRSDPQEQVEGFFLAEGVALRLDDLLDRTQHGDIPRPYPNLREYLRQKAGTRPIYFFSHEPQAFMAQLLASLGPDVRPLEMTKYRRSFKQSINLSGLEGSVSDFVRTSILDEKSINLNAMRESMNSWRSKQSAVARIKDQISRLELIADHYRRAQGSGQLRAGYLWCASELRFASADNRVEELGDELVGFLKDYRKIRRDQRRLIKDKTRLEEDLREVRRHIDSDQVESNRQRLAQRIESEKREVGYVTEALNNARSKLTLANDLLIFKEQLDTEAVTKLESLVKVSKDICGAWPEDPAKVDSAVSEAVEILGPVQDLIDNKRVEAHNRARDANQEATEVAARLDRLKEGKSDLHPSTTALMETLAERGIRATPVCDLVEVSDESWQPAIEARLNKKREALIVAPSDAEEAIRIYRQEKGRNAYGVTVVNTVKVAGWEDQSEPDTAAALIKGSDPLAVAYVRRQLRGIKLRDVETSELIKERRALSKDGMLVQEADVDRMRPPQYLMLGAKAREQQKATLEERLLKLNQERIAAKQDEGNCQTVYKRAVGLHQTLAEFPSLKALVSRLVKAQQDIDRITKDMEGLDTSHLEKFKKKEEELSEELGQLSSKHTKHENLAGQIRGEYKTKREDRRKVQELLPQLAEDRRKCEADEYFQNQKASELLEEMEQEVSEENAEQRDILARKCDNRAEDASKRQQRHETDGRDLLHEYLAAYPTDGFIMEPLSLAGTRVKIDDMLHELRDIGLHDREKEVAEALHKVQHVIRSEIATKLRSNIDFMRKQFSDLNRELRRRPFSSNQIYQFHYAQRGEYAQFLSFVDSIDDHIAADVGGLFDEFTHINEQIEEMLSSDDGDRLADYREYYTYDIQIQDTEAGISEMLSRRLGAASGGEHRTPYYVAIGASLASAYRLENRPDGSIDGGLSLYLADEAFEKMDSLNTLQAANYLNAIGLQMFIAAPDDAEPRLRQIVDTVMFFIREGDNAWVETDYVTDAAKELLGEVYGTRGVA